jgi:hypothetical protein
MPLISIYVASIPLSRYLFFRYTIDKYPTIAILMFSGLLSIIITGGKRKNYRIRLSIVFLSVIRVILSAVS